MRTAMRIRNTKINFELNYEWELLDFEIWVCNVYVLIHEKKKSRLSRSYPLAIYLFVTNLNIQIILRHKSQKSICKYYKLLLP